MKAMIPFLLFSSAFASMTVFYIWSTSGDVIGLTFVESAVVMGLELRNDNAYLLLSMPLDIMDFSTAGLTMGVIDGQVMFGAKFMFLKEIFGFLGGFDISFVPSSGSSFGIVLALRF